MNEALADYVQRREDILRRLAVILAQRLDVRRDADEIDPDTPLFGLGVGLDSIDAVELLVCVEVEFAISLDGERGLRALRTLGSLADAVMELPG